jgi:hypothetical protein
MLSPLYCTFFFVPFCSTSSFHTIPARAISGPFPSTLAFGSFLHYYLPSNFLSVGPVWNNFLQSSLLARTIMHLIPTGPISMSTFHPSRTSTLKMEEARSSETLVSSHHNTQCNSPEKHELCQKIYVLDEDSR